MAKGTYVLGYCDYNETGKKNCKATFEWELKDGNFTMCANIWNPRQTDIYTGGQCVDEVLKFFPNDRKAQRMAQIWSKYHLNDMIAGSPDQEKWKENNPEIRNYDEICKAMAEAGIDPDPNYIHNGKPYKYGSAWLKEEIPDDLVAEITCWGSSPEKTEDPFTKWLDERFEMSRHYAGVTEHADHYICNIVTKLKPGEPNKDKRIMTVNYYQGQAHRKDLKGRKYDPRDSNRLSKQFSPGKSAPTLKKVIDAIIADAKAYQENSDVADFCETFGYENFREGRRVWQGCEEQYHKLKTLAGTHFYVLMGTEDVPE